MANRGAVSKSAITTRSDTNHWFFGQFTSDLSKVCLPLKIDVVRLYLFKRHETEKSRLLEKDKNEIYTYISKRLIQIWTEASLPSKSEKAIFAQVKREIKEILDVVKKESPSSVIGVESNWNSFEIRSIRFEN